MKDFLKYIVLLGVLVLSTSCFNEMAHVRLNIGDSAREAYAIDELMSQLLEGGYGYEIIDSFDIKKGGFIIEVLKLQDGDTLSLKNEGFVIEGANKHYKIIGADATGVLYGCKEFMKRLKAEGGLPEKLNVREEPQMVLRGTCIGMQKTEFLPGRHVYEYPYTPENFPWFYDKGLWVEYLDMLVENKFNSFYLWNGHPFASLVKLKEYPYAVEVNDATFQMNKEMFSFITHEADKRGIFVIQMFYNILLSKPFAEKHGLVTQERNREITPLISDYTRKSIAEFVKEYPNVGLLVTLGEAMKTIDDDVMWFTEVIIPGVQDGLKALGRTDEPPIVLRGHDTDAERVMEAALPLYKNLYTTFKYNGESLTTYEPRASWSTIPIALSELGSVHISNVHILANLEPFRYGSPDFIQKSVKAMHKAQGANGLHLYPQASYWDWPYTADKTETRIKEMERDWIWYKAWARYAWNDNRDRAAEVNFWTNELNQFYATKDGKDILDAYEATGEIAPKLLRTFGISDGNRQTLMLGLTMGQLVNPFKYNIYQSFLESNGPVGEILVDYIRKDISGEEHLGETPPQIIEEVVAHAQKAVEAIENVGQVNRNSDEFVRLKNDVYCYNAIANFFYNKVKSASSILRYKYSGDVKYLQNALPFLEKSVEAWAELAQLTKETYLYANSMQTDMRRIPLAGKDGKNKDWSELLTYYENELAVFKRNLARLESGDSSGQINKSLEPVEVEILNNDAQVYSLKAGEKVFADAKYQIATIAEELNRLKAVRFSEKSQRENGTKLKFKCNQSVKVVVGYFNTNSYTIAQPPTLETNALANDRGQADLKIANVMNVPGLYPVNVYTYKYEPGEYELELEKGRVLILGFISGDTNIQIHDAGVSESDSDEVAIDWLFY